MAENSIEGTFTRRLLEKFQHNLNYLLPKTKYQDIIQQLKASLGVNRKTARQYKFQSRYEILQCGHVDKLIKRRKSPTESPLYFVTIEETYVQATNINSPQVDEIATDENVALFDARQGKINFHREQSRKFQMEQAERMVKRSRIELAPGQKGDNVAIPIPLVNHGRGDPRNILAVVMDRSENDNYTLATKHGILKGTYSRNEFELCPEKLLLMSDVNCTRLVSLRERLYLALNVVVRVILNATVQGRRTVKLTDVNVSKQS